MRMYLEKVIATIGDGECAVDFEVDVDYDLRDGLATITSLQVYLEQWELTDYLDDATLTAAECHAAAAIEERHGCSVAIGEVAR